MTSISWRRRGAAATAAVLTAAALVVASPAAPVGATVTASVSGTAVTVTMTGDGTANLGCGAGGVRISGVAVSPALACSALTAITVNGDGGNQTVDYHETTAGPTAFPSLASCTTTLGGGNDVLEECAAADTADLGEGNDTVLEFGPGAANSSIELGLGTNSLDVWGTDDPETMKAFSGGTSAVVQYIGPGGTTFRNAFHVSALALDGFGGDDVMSAAGVTAASSISDTALYGDDDDDTLTAGAKSSHLDGGDGTNSLTGGPASDFVNSHSTHDTIDSGGSRDYVTDEMSLHSGGRALVGAAGDDIWFTSVTGGDVVARSRPLSGTSVQITTALTRNGQQTIGATASGANVYTATTTGPDARALGDFVLGGGKALVFAGDRFGDDVVDVTVPTGTWTVTGPPATGATIDSTAFPDVNVRGVGVLSVHGPWTDKGQGFAHRVIRDLLFRIPKPPERDSIRDRLASGATTRPTVISSLMGTDVYRGLDVDRAFVRFLGRTPDASGRTYWIGRVAGGASLAALRADLMGSSEFFTKAGGTNTAYVKAAYRAVMGRDPDAAGLTYWVGRIEAGTARRTVAGQFLATDEARRAIVTDQFLRFAGRLPTSGEYTTWVGTLTSSATGEQALVASLAASITYYNRT